ncbi:esterase-like activity of phytase family protein [Promicromonospora iranensis]|uniref:DNA-binding beta-propeller fold protein YncE n=1 Tax=Promicromonospora iranensis TaxID=1105144 RepID=A0ABU2CPU6_9MICO|nr:esterase-like activity of phytase family protein [Promicromonospora iranensis]MDR7383359.1 DNA-binding beta-propeller fold protein YncE [Promicromonospora iranensis]
MSAFPAFAVGQQAATGSTGAFGVSTSSVNGVGSAPGAGSTRPGETFHRLATYPVFLNAPADVDPADETVAEISAISEDGNTLVHTDAAARRIGFLDISDPAAPRGLGSLSLAELGSQHDEPTSVAIVGDYVLVVVDSSTSFTSPSGRLDVVDLATRTRVRSIDLGGQPDSIAVTHDGAHAVIAMENQRDEDVLADTGEGEEGDLPQAPAGFLQFVDLPSADPATWQTRPVELDVAALSAAGLDTPQDAEPEYVSINPSDTKVAVTLQENNGIAVLDVVSGELENVFSAGDVALEGVDVADDGAIDQTGSLEAAPREPDAIGWVDDEHVATANEGDWKGGTRGWTVFEAATGDVVWDAGTQLEELAVRVGLHNDDRAGKKGVEMEGLAVATLDGVRYAFVGSERSNFVAVYDVSDPASPRFVQVLATTNGPEGILPVPARNLLVVSSEEDSAKDGVRASVSLFGKGKRYSAAAGSPAFPSIVSADVRTATGASKPIGWTALGALSADPAKRDRLWTVTDAAKSPTSILSVSTAGQRGKKARPVVIDREIVVTEDGEPVGLDAEGIWARPSAKGRTGGFWLGVEGATGTENALVRVSASGRVEERVSLPDGVAAGLGKWGIEGVTGTVDRTGEHLFVALQRGLTSDDGVGGYARIGRYDVATGEWTWFGYPLSAPTAAGDWVGLSEVTMVDRDTLAVIERDKLNGPAAALKAVYTVDLPRRASSEGVTMLDKELAIDVLPALRATNGWAQEKLEGLTIGGDGHVYAVTDNDGVEDATGESVFLDLGKARKLFR